MSHCKQTENLSRNPSYGTNQCVSEYRLGTITHQNSMVKPVEFQTRVNKKILILMSLDINSLHEKLVEQKFRENSLYK